MTSRNKIFSVLFVSFVIGGLPIGKVFATENSEHYDFLHHNIAEVMQQFMAENNLSEENFSMSYELSDGSLSYNFAENVFRVAASTYKVPLNMYFYDLERQGAISSATKIGEHTLGDIRRQSLVYSDNVASEELFSYLGWYTFREKVSSYYEQDYDECFFTKNCINTAYLNAVMKRAYENREDYTELLDYLEEASPDKCFKYDNDDIEMAHKYGSWEGANNDTAIIYTSTPFYLSVLTQGVPGANGLLSRVARLMFDYTNYYLAMDVEPVLTFGPVTAEPKPEIREVTDPAVEVVKEVNNLAQIRLGIIVGGSCVFFSTLAAFIIAVRLSREK